MLDYIAGSSTERGEMAKKREGGKRQKEGKEEGRGRKGGQILDTPTHTVKRVGDVFIVHTSHP